MFIQSLFLPNRKLVNLRVKIFIFQYNPLPRLFMDQVGPNTTPEKTECLCTHLTDFGGDVMVAPNPIDMGAVFEGLKNLGDNLGVLLVILTIFLVYALLCVWSRKKDRQDEIDVSSPLSFYIRIFYNCFILSILIMTSFSAGNILSIHKYACILCVC